MAEAKEEIDRDEQEIEEERGNGICEGDDHSESQLPNTSEADLNLLLVFLSLFSPPNEECIDSEENKQSIQDEACISRLQTKRRQINEAKLVRRPTQSFRTTVRDCRHGRKM
ncbi:hypothetical protein L6164_021204 [Bauhinia variegata]|uniref:Uncharacterized protein n=1 Tax=Bauhinia variegata TaxID=167791 RepID=A0ACB9MXT6_BAUVA|nr:hypothetical protein L6164_021204 [Bauhinia variegata]